MLQGHFYHKTLRKIVAAFGTMFNAIVIVKYDENMIETERAKVPLSYAQKEKFILAMLTDDYQTRPTQVELPRMSFEMTGMMYDASRKLPSIGRILSKHPTDKTKLFQNYQPVPYDFTFDLNIYTRNIEDMSQIIEQIVPYFTPDFTVTVELVADNSGQTISKDIPITLNAINPQINYEGDGITPRYVIYTMNFSLKAYLYGPTSASSIIRKAITNIYDTVGNHTEDILVLTPGGAGQFRYEETVYSGNNWINADWTGRVLYWANSGSRLAIYDVSGKLLPNVGDTVIGLDSGARWTIVSGNRTFVKHSKTIIEPLPNTANVGDANISYTYVTTEFPNAT